MIDRNRRAVKRLNEVLVDEIVRAHLGRDGARGRRLADLIAERIVRLGGAPDYSALSSALRRGTARAGPGSAARSARTA